MATLARQPFQTVGFEISAEAESTKQESLEHHIVCKSEEYLCT